MEISEILDIPVNLIQVRLHRARKKLEVLDSTPRKITSMILQADTPVGNA
ncbi:sigma factor-like helix-turn-helix DNA-binding protein [Brevibacillus formosus]